MKYDEIKKLLEEYGENYLEDNTIQKLLETANKDEAIKKQLEEGITKKWQEQVKKCGRILVYTDYFKKNNLFSNKPEHDKFPYITCGLQDQAPLPWSKEERDIPNIKFVEQWERNGFDKELVRNLVKDLER